MIDFNKKYTHEELVALAKQKRYTKKDEEEIERLLSGEDPIYPTWELDENGVPKTEWGMFQYEIDEIEIEYKKDKIRKFFGVDDDDALED